jgi:hypothetical protein
MTQQSISQTPITQETQENLLQENTEQYVNNMLEDISQQLTGNKLYPEERQMLTNHFQSLSLAKNTYQENKKEIYENTQAVV